MDKQLPFELVEFSLRRQAVPNVLTVIVRGVGMLAPDDDIGEAEILPINGVHDRLLGPAVKHFDVQAQK